MNDYERVARIIRFLDAHHGDQPDLAALARYAGLSPSRLHHLFSAWASITPKDFLQCLTLAHAREILKHGESVLDASFQAGLSGPGRLHDLFVTLEAATPGEIKAGGAGWTVTAGVADSPFGPCLIGQNPRGICHLAFVDTRRSEAAWTALQERWPNARLWRDNDIAAKLARQIFLRPGARDSIGRALRAFVRGTPFQVRVWQALLRIPPGALVSYRQLAEALDQPSAARAVGSAVARNPLAYLIPCHRVIRETGVLGGYRWGSERKRAIVAWEGALAS